MASICLAMMNYGDSDDVHDEADKATLLWLGRTTFSSH